MGDIRVCVRVCIKYANVIVQYSWEEENRKFEQ